MSAAYNRGLAKTKLGERKGVVADFIRAFDLKPDVAAYNNRGIANAMLGRKLEALEDFIKAIELGHSVSQKALALCSQTL